MEAALYESIINYSDDAIISITLDGMITSWNKGAEAIFGYTANEVISKHITILMPPDRLNEEKEIIDKIKKGEAVRHYETERIRKDRRIVNIALTVSPLKDKNGVVTGASKIAHDITRQVQAKELYEKTQYRYKQVVDNILDGLMIDDPEGRVLYANDQFLKLFGLEEADLENLVLEDYIAPEFRPILRDRHNRRVAGEEVPTTFEYQGLMKDGTRIWLEVRVCKVTEGDKVIGTQSAVRNITDRKLAEANLHKLNQELEQKVLERTAQLQELNKELESFSYSVAHDLRGPLRIINGYSEILRKEYQSKLDGEADRIINVIVNNTQRMGKLIDELLNLARLGRKDLVKQYVDMNELVSVIINEQTSLAHKAIKFDVASLPGAVCDSTLIRQVWSNLISNAIKYSGKQEAPAVTISAAQKDNAIVYTIKDNGVGFDMQYIDKLFGVFQRLHKQSEFEGVGIGLALVHRIITRHGGSIWAEAEEDKGASFHFSLPVVK